MDSKNKYLEGTALRSDSTNELSSPFVDEVFFDSQLLNLESPHSSYQVLEQENTTPFDNEELELESSEIFDEAESYFDEDDEDETEDDFIDLSGEETEVGDSFTDELTDEIELLEDKEFEEYDDYLNEEENSYQEWEALGEDDSDFSQEEIYETDALEAEDAEIEDFFELFDDETEVEFAEEESGSGLTLKEKYDEDDLEHDQDDYNDETGFDDEKDYQGDYNTKSSQEVWNFENIEGIPNTAQSLVHNIVKIANNEYANWNKGKLHETNDEAKKYLERYWGTVVDSKGINWRIRQRRPWSAAFISYVVNKAGGHPPFKLSRAHIAYARVAKRNRARNKLEEPISMWFYRIQEIRPQVGDILFHSRIQRNKDKTIDRKRTGANYDNIANGNDWATHSDIVVDVDESKGCIYVIGGNVKQSVFKRKRDLDRNGYVKLTGRKLNDFFGILRFFDPKPGASSSINTLENTQSNAVSRNHDPILKSASAPSSNSLNNLIHKGKKIYLYGKAFYLAATAISNGEKNAVKITDSIFYDLYPSRKGRTLQANDPLIKTWKYIHNTVVKPMLAKLDKRKQRTIPHNRNASPRFRMDSRSIPKYRDYFTKHSEPGSLTKSREGMHSKPEVPKGLGNKSGVTFGGGIDLATFVNTSKKREELIRLIAPNNRLLAQWIRDVPMTRGDVAQKWLAENPMKGGDSNNGQGLGKGQLNMLFEYARLYFTRLAKIRLLGRAFGKNANASPPLTLAEYNNLALNPTNSKDDFIHQLLVDLVWNSAQFTGRPLSSIAKALRVEETGNKVEMQIMRLYNLRDVIDKGTLMNRGGKYGRWRRLGWIDTKIDKLKSRL